jgi:nicotinamide mononucleotide adenylyltransferase
MMNDETWEDLVPEPVCEIIKEIGGVQRIKNSVKQ